ncbi:MAG: hypothetical protein PHQ53_09945 [Candidatus Krumholzibacteria bacterium]|nr:hypothetical protein [Candidatus Krumholzibacteria bacterium]
MHARLSVFIGCVLILQTACLVAARADPPVAADPQPAGWRNGEWSRRFQPMGMAVNMGGAAVKCMTDWDGSLAVGGWFNEVGGLEANHVAVWNGLHWRTLAGGLGWEANALHDHGRLVVGGNFHTVDGEPIEYVAQWDDQDRRWYSMGEIAGEVRAFCEQFGGFYAAGQFLNPVGSLAHWIGSNWDYPGVSVGLGTINAMEDFYNSIYFGGAFYGNGALSLYGWDGENDIRHDLDGNVHCLLRDGYCLYVGGSFEHADGVESHGLVKLWAGGGFQAVPEPLVDRNVRGLARYQDAIYVATDQEVRLCGADSWSEPLGGTFDGQLLCLATCQPLGGLFAGGRYIRLPSVLEGQDDAWNVLRWDRDQWCPVGGAGSNVTALHVHQDELIAGGMFTTIGGISAGRIARWDGAQWRTLGTGANNTVRALATYQGQLIAAGDFTTAGGIPAAHIARWDGSAWHPLGDGVGGQSVIDGVTALLGSTEDLFVGGDFTEAQGEIARGVAVWDGAAWSELGGGVHDGYEATRVNDLLVKDGNLYVGGDFARVGATIASRKLALWLDGVITPTLLRSFLVRVMEPGSVGDGHATGRTVAASWSTSRPSEPEEFRLTARATGRTWSVPSVMIDGEDVFRAHDCSGNLAAVDEVVYTLAHAANGQDWRIIAEQAVALGPPSPARIVRVYPNPFNPLTAITFDLMRTSRVRVDGYALTGRRITTLAAESLPPGRHTRTWDGLDAQGREVASGSYLLRLVTEERITSAKATLVR